MSMNGPGGLPALLAEGLSKTYRVYSRPIDRLKELLLRRPCHTEFRALADVNLRVECGTTLGIMGDNGAGKSTLLQLLSGILTPTSGSVTHHGTVLGLLELGIGFHPEFTGRQNVFFYGDLLGLDRAFVAGKLGDIIDFSELLDFIDQPIKTYSTGMRMRLAFALVSTLDPEILIIDEALAVGDVHFQKKCIDRMLEIRGKGRTILFCSHSSYQISMFCDEVIWLKQGRIHRRGPPAEVIPVYEAYQAAKSQPGRSADTPFGGTPVMIQGFELLNELPLRCGDDLSFRIEVVSSDPSRRYHVTLSLKMDTGRGVFVTGTHMQGVEPLSGSHRRIVVTYPAAPLMGGLYSAHARIFDDQGLMLYHERVLPDIEVRKEGKEMGICRMPNRWEIA